MKSLHYIAAGIVALIFALLAQSAPAAAQPCQWNYSFVANVATATYCGQVISSASNTVATVASLASLPNSASVPGAAYTVLGYNTAGDGGGGTFLAVTGTSAGDKCVNFPGANSVHWVRQFNGGNLSVEMCGAYNDGTNAATTLAAFQAANDFVAASPNPQQEIDFKGASYNFGTAATGVVKAASFYCPNWVGGGASTGAGGTKIAYSPTSEAAAFTFVGGSGALCGGGIKGAWFQGSANMDAVEIDGQGGVILNIVTFTPYFRAVVLNNKASGQFSEFDQSTVNTNGTQTALEYRVTSGNASFHGSGLVNESVINFGCNNTPAILIGTGAVPYAAPMDAHFFPASGSCNIIQNNGASSFGEIYFAGNVQVEQGGATAVTMGGGGDFLLLGNVSYFGNGFAQTMGAMYLANNYSSLGSGLGIVSFKPINKNIALTGATTAFTWPRNAQNQSWILNLYVQATGYSYYKTCYFLINPANNNYTLGNVTDTLLDNTAGFGAISITAANSSGFTFGATTGTYPATGGIATFTLTQLGQSSSFHGQ